MHRLPQLEHDVVGDIDDGTYRTHAGAAQALTNAQGRLRAIVYAANHTTYEGRTRCRSVEVDREAIIGAWVALRDMRPRYLIPGERPHLACNANYRHSVATIRGDVELENGVIELEVIAQRTTQRRILCKFDDTGGVVREPELLGGTQRAGGLDATQLRPLDLQPAGHARAHHSECGLQTRTRVGRAADDLQKLTALPCRHATNLQLVSLRVPLSRHDFRDDN